MTKLDDNGTIVKVYDCLKQKFISEHPDSKMELIGIRVPGYTEVRELALRASNCFGFLGTIGWDIAYSDDGAIILEGNTLWGCDNIQFLYGGIINDEIARSLKTHYFWQRWDKTRMYPAMGKKRRIRFPWQRPLK